MFQYLSKFLIQILPSVTATVIGGFIVHTWIMPKAATDTPRAAIVSKASADTGEADHPANTKPELKPANVKGIAMSPKDAGSKDSAQKDAAQKDQPQKDSASAKADDAKLRGSSDAPAADARHAAKPASPEKPTGNAADKSKAAGPVAATPEVTAAVTPPADDKRNASDLARTALERLRATGEQPRIDNAREPAKPALEARAVEPQRNPPQSPSDPVQAAVAPQPALMPMGPPINIRAPRYSEAAMSDSAHDDDTRMVPPGEIPEMHRTVETREGRTSIADDVVSATRSVLRAVLPK